MIRLARRGFVDAADDGPVVDHSALRIEDDLVVEFLLRHGRGAIPPPSGAAGQAGRARTCRRATILSASKAAPNPTPGIYMGFVVDGSGELLANVTANITP